MFGHILDQEPHDLLSLGLELQHSANHASACLLCLDYAFTYLLDTTSSETLSSTILDTGSFIPAFKVYAKLLMDYENRDTWNAYHIKRDTQRASAFIIPDGTYLSLRAKMYSIESVRKKNGDKSLTLTSLLLLLRQSIAGGRLRGRLSNVNEASKQATTLVPCVSFSMSGTCLALRDERCMAGCHGGDNVLGVIELHQRLELCCSMIELYGAVKTEDDIIWVERYVPKFMM